MFKGHPKGLVAAALSNMGERFGYYIMNAVLLLFLVSKFGLSDATAGVIYSVFYCAIYVLSLVGGIIADRSQNYKGTIQSGLIVMALGYILLAIPITATVDNQVWLLPFTCVALAFIAFGNGLFKGNLQAIVGQMYDNLEEEAAKEGEEALKIAKSKRDSGFQIFYVFINVGGLIAPFVAPYLREWWLKVNGFVYNAKLPELCHKVIDGTIGDRMSDYESISQSVTLSGSFTPEAYLEVFNQGVHYSFIASVFAMLISLVIFLTCKKMFPNPAKKENNVVEKCSAEEKLTEESSDLQALDVVEQYSVEEKQMMAKEIKQRMYALFAVLGIAVFFWFAFHQNGQSLSLFARDFVKTDAIAPEIWQAVNPFFVIILTPIIMWIFGALTKKGKEISTPRKIAIGMFIAGLAYLFLMILSIVKGYPSGSEFRSMEESVAMGMKSDWWVMFVLYFFLTVAELFISPLGLSFVSKVAPKNLLGLCQGLWLGATALGNLLIWIGPVMYNAWPIWACWAVFLGVCLLSMFIMLFMIKWLEKVTK